MLPAWLAPVPGNLLKARCRCCRVTLTAHFTGLLQHARTSKHIQSVISRPQTMSSQQTANGLWHIYYLYYLEQIGSFILYIYQDGS